MHASGSVASLERPQTNATATSLKSSGSVAAIGGAPRGTRSMCGSQVLSHKSSAPSFSFGSAPPRLTFTGAAARGKQTLQASVSSGGASSPGPIYNPSPASKWLGDVPHAQFGTQQQRPPSSAGQEISKLTGKSNLPGPGAYTAPSAFGKQALGRSHSYSMYSFGNQRQRESAAKMTPSPGPVYDPKGSYHGSLERPQYSFGNDVRTKNRDASMRTPGPGTYSLKTALGPQPSSQQRSGMVIGFGAPGANSNRGMLPLEGRYSPGPIYMNAAACKKQALSTRRSAGKMAFSRDDRFRHSRVATAGEVPGPGEYVV